MEKTKDSINFLNALITTNLQYVHRVYWQIKHLPSDLNRIGGEVSLIVDDNAGESSGPPKT